MVIGIVEVQKTSKHPCETHPKRVVTVHHESHVPEVDWGTPMTMAPEAPMAQGLSNDIKCHVLRWGVNQ